MGAPVHHIELADFLNIKMHRATRKLTLMFVRDVLQPEGLTIPEWRTLLYLGKYGDRHLRALARTAGLDPSHVSKAAVELEHKGLVHTCRDDRDKRRKRLTVTKKGFAKIERIWPQATGLSSRIEAEIGSKKYSALKAALLAIIEIDELAAEGLNQFDPAE